MVYIITTVKGVGTLNIKDISWHRNGVTGAGFHVVRFDWTIDEATSSLTGQPTTPCKMVATVFRANGHIAVPCVDDLAANKIDIRYCGVDFEKAIREAIATDWY